jgi:5-methylthioadenosine/S-adenosylhomocysteine deaminase
MESIDTLVCARWVIPVEPDGCALDDHAVAVRDGRVVAVLPTREALRRFDAREVVERPNHVALPGFVDAHAGATRLPGPRRAGTAPFASPAPGARVPRPAADPDLVRTGIELAIAAMLRSGVTCFAATPLRPDVAAQCAATAHVRASIGLPVSETTTGWATDADEHIDRGMKLRDEYRGDPLVTMHLAPRDPAGCSDATLARVRRLADELDMPVALPLHGPAHDPEQGARASGRRPLARLAALGLVSPQLVAVHLTRAEPGDIDLLSGSGASVVHCPRSDLAQGWGTCPVARLLGRGIRVALGTGPAGTWQNFDLLAEARLAGLVSDGIAATPGELVASDLLRMATLEGARTLGLGELTGSLLPGKWADLCCVDLRTPRSWPVHDAADALLYAASSRQVTDTWVAGRRLLADGRLALLDEAAVLEQAEAWSRRIDADPAEELPGDD